MQTGLLISTPLAVLVGFVAGVVSVQTFAPDLLTEQRRSLPSAVTARLISAGDFEAIDSVRRTSGRAQLLDAGQLKILRFADFRVTTAPDLQVWLSTAESVRSSEEVRAVDVLQLGALNANSGDQTYILPDEIDLSQFRSVLIWCAEFGSLYGVAPLEG